MERSQAEVSGAGYSQGGFRRALSGVIVVKPRNLNDAETCSDISSYYFLLENKRQPTLLIVVLVETSSIEHTLGVFGESGR